MRVSLLAVVAGASLLSAPALAQEPIDLGDSCLSVEHFPDQPVGNAPSKAVLYVMLPAEWGGGTIVVEYSGASGDLTGTGPVAGDGLGTAQLPLYSYGPHQIDQVIVTDPNNNTSPIDVNQLPDGGTFTVDEAEPQCDPATMTAATTTSTAPTTTAAATTTASTSTASTTTASTVSTTVLSSTTVPLPLAATTGPIGPWALIASGAVLALLGLWLLRKKNCEDLYALWQAAKERYETCAEELLKAQAWLEEKRAERSRLEEELRQLENSAATGSISQGATSYQSLPGKGLVTVEGMAEIMEGVRTQIDHARQSELMGEEMVDNWRKRTEESAAQAEAARRAYEECVGTSSTSSTSNAQGSVATSTAPPTAAGAGSATMITAERPGGCPEGDRRAVALGKPTSFRIYRAFRIETETEGEAWAGEAGDQLAADLKELGAELGLLGSLLGAQGSGARIADGVVTANGAGLVRGAVEGYAAAYGNLGTADFPIPIPTSPQEVLVGVLQLIAQLAGTAAGKASEWTKRRTLRSFRLVKEYQTITVQPYQIEICDRGTYRCVERVRQYTIGGSGRETGGWRDGGQGLTEIDQARQEREVRILVNQGRQAMERSVKSLMEYEQRYPVGACP